MKKSFFGITSLHFNIKNNINNGVVFLFRMYAAIELKVESLKCFSYFCRKTIIFLKFNTTKLHKQLPSPKLAY